MLISRPQQPQVAGVAADKFPLGQHLHDVAVRQRLTGGEQRQAADPRCCLTASRRTAVWLAAYRP
jgi:hypothetical protein